MAEIMCYLGSVLVISSLKLIGMCKTTQFEGAQKDRMILLLKKMTAKCEFVKCVAKNPRSREGEDRRGERGPPRPRCPLRRDAFQIVDVR